MFALHDLSTAIGPFAVSASKGFNVREQSVRRERNSRHAFNIIVDEKVIPAHLHFRRAFHQKNSSTRHLSIPHLAISASKSLSRVAVKYLNLHPFWMFGTVSNWGKIFTAVTA